MWAAFGMQLAHELIAKEYAGLHKYKKWSEISTVILKVENPGPRERLQDCISHMAGCAFDKAHEKVERVQYTLDRFPHFVPKVRIEQVQNDGDATARFQCAKLGKIRDVYAPTECEAIVRLVQTF